MGVEETYRAALAQQLPTRSGSGTPPSIGMAPASPASLQMETVVISGDGVQSSSTAASGSRFPMMPPGKSAVRGGFQRASGLPATGGANVATIYFGVGSAGLDANDRKILRNVMRLHQQRGGRLHVVGHASSRTRDMPAAQHQQVNASVSAKRADSIARELARLGVKRENIVVTARADMDPQYYEIMPSGEAGNRRAEVFIYH